MILLVWLFQKVACFRNTGKGLSKKVQQTVLTWGLCSSRSRDGSSPFFPNRSGKRDVIRRGRSELSPLGTSLAGSRAFPVLGWHRCTPLDEWDVVKPIPNRKGHWMVNGGRKSGELPSKHFMKTRRKSRYTTVHWCLPESVHQRTCHVVTRFARLVHQSEGPKGDYFFIKVAFAMQMTFSNDIPNVYPRRWSDLHSSIPQLISWDRHSERLDHKEMECEIVKCISTTGGFVGSCCLIFAP